MSDEPVGAEPVPVLRVVRGRPGPADLAALIAVLAARPRAAGSRAGLGTAPDRAGRSVWADPRRLLGVPPRPERGAWAGSARPR